MRRPREMERKSRKRSVNEQDRVLSISPGQIDHRADGSVTPDLCVRIRKLQYCTALVANEICSLIKEEQGMEGRGRLRSGRRKMSELWGRRGEREKWSDEADGQERWVRS